MTICSLLPESVDGPLDVLLGEVVDGVVARVREGEGRQRHGEERGGLGVDSIEKFELEFWLELDLSFGLRFLTLRKLRNMSNHT